MGKIHNKVNGVWTEVLESSALTPDRKDPAKYIVTDIQPTGVLPSTIPVNHCYKSYYFNGKVYWLVISTGCKVYSWDPATKTVTLEASDTRVWQAVGNNTALPTTLAWERSSNNGIINIWYGYSGTGWSGNSQIGVSRVVATTIDLNTMIFGSGFVATIATWAVADGGSATTGSFNGHGSNSGYNSVRIFSWITLTYNGTSYTPDPPRGWGSDPLSSNSYNGDGGHSLTNMTTEIANSFSTSPGTQNTITYLDHINSVKFGASRWWRDVSGKRGILANNYGPILMVGYNSPGVELQYITFPPDEVPPTRPIDSNDVIFFYESDKFYIMRRTEGILLTCKIEQN